MMKIRSFRTRIIVIIIPLIVLACMSYLLFFLNRTNDRLERELMTRGISLARNLASSSELALLSEDITFLESSLTGISEEEDVVYVIIYNQGGQVIASNKKVELNEELTDEVIQRVWSEKVPLQRKDYAKNGELFYDFLAPVTVTSGFAGWGSLGEQIGVVRIALSLDRIKSERIRILLIGMIAVFFFIGLGIVAAVVLARRMSRPLDRLMEGVRAISSGDLEHRLDIATSDEIGKLASAFNQMTDGLKKSKQEIEVYSKTLERRVEERTKELDEKVRKLEKSITERKQAENMLRESEKKYRELVQNTNSIILRMDSNGHITFFNKFAQKFFGYTEDEILGKNLVGTIIPEMNSSHRDLKAMIKDIIKNPEKY
ncbi:MAG: HAMP domain-containing protein, partial [bacterium]|nr:HAMP domain-containing protein [bacterium]